MKTAKLNEFNDIVCPECGVNVISPKDNKLRTGLTRCGWCGAKFKVDIENMKKEDDKPSDNWPTIDN